jgi:uncharacterized protein YqgC (DUF456 family)
MEIFAFILLVMFSLVGFAAIFFTTFGTLIILIGTLLYALLTGLTVIDLRLVIILLTLYFMGEVLEYAFVIIGAKKFGASNAAVGGAIAGGIVGAILGSTMFGFGLVPGTFFGIFAGAFFVEYLLRKDVVMAVKAGAGGLIGRLGSIIAKVGIAIVMIIMVFSRIADYSPY